MRDPLGIFWALNRNEHSLDRPRRPPDDQGRAGAVHEHPVRDATEDHFGQAATPARETWSFLAEDETEERARV